MHCSAYKLVYNIEAEDQFYLLSKWYKESVFSIGKYSKSQFKTNVHTHDLWEYDKFLYIRAKAKKWVVRGLCNVLSPRTSLDLYFFLSDFLDTLHVQIYGCGGGWVLNLKFSAFPVDAQW